MRAGPLEARGIWILALLILSVTSLLVGAVPLGFADVWRLLTGESTAQTELVVLELRLPRTLMALVTGAILATGGAVMQSLLRNPLAEPGLVGVSAGAALGAVSLMFCGVSGFLWIGLSGFAGALFATFIAWQLARGWHGSAGLLLAGVAINAVVFSLISLLISLSSDTQIRSITFWSLGSMTRAPAFVVYCLVVWSVIGWWLMYRHWPALNALLLGDQAAAQVGVRVKPLRFFYIILMALLVGPLTAFTGAISFIGLLVPQVIRRRIGSDHRRLLPLAALWGGLAVLGADILTRVLLAPAELPIGVVISLVGAPAFMWVLRQQRR